MPWLPRLLAANINEDKIFVVSSMKHPKKMKLSKWAAREFTACSVPNVKTLRKWVDIGKVRGTVIDGHYFVFEDFRFGDVSSAVVELIRQSA